MATLSTLVIKRLRNVVTQVQVTLDPVDEESDPVITGRVFGAPVFFQALMDAQFNVALPSIFVIDERDTASPSNGGQTSYQDISTEIDIAVAIAKLGKEQAGLDLKYLDDLSDIKDKIFEALLNWGYTPNNALDRTEGLLDNVNDHGAYAAEYVSSETTLSQNGYLFHVFTFRFNYMIDGAAPPSETYSDFLHFYGNVNESEEDFEVTEEP